MSNKEKKAPKPGGIRGGRCDTNTKTPALTATNVIDRPHIVPPSAADRIVALIAPSGYGKSTLALQWSIRAQRHGHKVSWIQIDEKHRDSTVFLETFANALGVDATEEINSFKGDDDHAAFIDDLMTQVDKRNGWRLLFIDDIHLLSDGSSLRCLRQIIRFRTTKLTIVLASQSAEGLELATASLTSQVRWITERNLILKPAEIASIALYHGLHLSENEVEYLETLTEGWPALTQLALIGLNRTDQRVLFDSITGIRMPVANYIYDQFLARLSNEQKNAIAILATLGEAPSDLLNEVSTHPVLPLLNEFERLGMIRRHYLYRNTALFTLHPLLRDEVLRRNLIELSERLEIKKKAAYWWWRNNDRVKAIKFAIDSQDVELARCWLVEFGPVLVHDEGRHETFLELAQYSSAISTPKYDPVIVGLTVSALMFLRRYNEAEQVLIKSEQYHLKVDKLSTKNMTDSADWQRSVIAGLRDDYVMSGRFAQKWIAETGADGAMARPFHAGMAWTAVAFSQKCRNMFIEAEASLNQARDYMEIAQSNYGMIWVRSVSDFVTIKRGRLRELAAEAALKGENPEDELPGATELMALSQSIFAFAQYEQDNLMQCQQTLEFVIPRLYRQGVVDAMITGYVAGARLEMAFNRFDRALDILADGLRVALDRGLARLRVTLLAERAAILARYGAVKEAWEAARDSGLLVERATTGLQRDKSIRLFARLALAEKRPDKIGGLLVHSIEHARRTRQCYKLAELLMFESIRRYCIGDSVASALILSESLEIGAINGYCRIYRDNINDLSEILNRLLKTDLLSPVGAALARSVLVNNLSPTLVSEVCILSSREQQILGLVAEGHSNQSVAQILFLSEGTVKWHLHNVFDRLGVRSRTAAIRMARSYGLIPKE